MVTIKSKREIELMREAGRVTALTHKAIEDAIKPGMTTADIDRIAEETMKKYGAVSAEKGYDPGIRGVPKFPASTCISVNDEVIHGIPHKNLIIKDGDKTLIDQYSKEEDSATQNHTKTLRKHPPQRKRQHT